MKIKNFFPLLLSCLLFFGLFSCGGDDENPEPGQDCNPWEEHYNEMATAQTAYANEQTPENCNAFKAAYADYLTAYREYGNCFGFTGANLEEFEEAIEEAETELDNIECN